jgi:hypothetical protein
MCKLVNMSEYFKQAEVVHGHQFLLNDFNAFDALNFFLAYSDDTVFDVITQLDEAVVLSVLIFLLG